jgi:hypothetical protein
VDVINFISIDCAKDVDSSTIDIGYPKSATGKEQETNFDGSLKDARNLIKLEKTQVGEEIGRFNKIFKVIIPETVEDDMVSTKNEDLYSRRNKPMRTGCFNVKIKTSNLKIPKRETGTSHNITSVDMTVAIVLTPSLSTHS